MNRRELAERKALLLARSSLYRLTLARDMTTLHESLHWRNLLASARHSGSWRPLALGALLLVVGRGRIGGIIGIAARALAVVKMVRAVLARRKA
ncbi:MAG: hypothetical protein ACXWG1_02980 [Usitatibacter sp.]